MSWIAVAIAGSAVLGAGTSMMAADKAAAGGERGIQMQAGQAGMNKMELDPFRNFGVQNMTALQQGLGIGNWDGGYTANGFDPNAPLMKPFSLADFKESPAYQFNLAEGTKAIDKAANARGNLYAPQTLQDISKFAQGTASNEFNNAYNMFNQNQTNQYNRLAGGVQTGLGAASALSGVNTNLANNMSEGAQGIGNAQGAGIMGAGNAVQGGIGQYYNQYLMNQILKQNQGSFVGGGAGVTGV